MSVNTSEVSVFTKGPSGVQRYRLDENGLYNASQVQYFPEYQQIQGLLLAASVSGFIAVVHNGIWAVASVATAHTVVGGSGATVIPVVCPQRVAIASGVEQISAAVDLTVTAPSGGFGTLIASPTAMTRGDALGLKFAGTLTGLVGCYDIILKRIG